MNVSQINIIKKLRSRQLKTSVTSEENDTQRGRQMCYTSHPVLVWMKTASTVSIYNWMLSPLLVELLGKDWVVWPCWRRCVLLRVSFEISRAHARCSLSLSFSISLPAPFSFLYLPATMPPVIMIGGSKTLSHSPIKAFFIGVALVMVCLCSNRIETRHKLTWVLSSIVPSAIILITLLLSRSRYWLFFQTSYCMRLGEQPENMILRNPMPMEEA